MRKRSEVLASRSLTEETAEKLGVSPEAVDEQALDEDGSREPEAPRPLFQTAHGRGAKPGELTPDMGALVETVYRVPDMHREYEALERALHVGEKRGDYATILRALDEAETNARRAHRLYLAARLEQEKWALDAEATAAGMRKHATSELEDEKARGDRKKAITNDDVEAKISELYPDEWRHQREKRVRVKGTVEAMERLADLWKGRCHTLGIMLQTMRK